MAGGIPVLPRTPGGRSGGPGLVGLGGHRHLDRVVVAVVARPPP